METSGIHKAYDLGEVRVELLKGIDLAIQRGEMVGIVGPSGCGKTTLLNCLLGLDGFDDGDVRIGGVSLREMSDRGRTDYRARRMGFVFQFYNLIPVLTSVENVELPLLVSGVGQRDARRRAVDALALVRRRPRRHQRPGRWSSAVNRSACCGRWASGPASSASASCSRPPSSLPAPSSPTAGASRAGTVCASWCPGPGSP